MKENRLRRSKGQRWIAYAAILGLFGLPLVIGLDQQGPRGREQASAPRADSGSVVSPAAVWVSAVRVQGGASSTSAYDPSVPLVRQLRRLRDLADLGDAHAACIVASALDLCARGADRIPIAGYEQLDPTSLGDTDIDRIAESIEFADRYAATCDGLTRDNFIDMEASLLQAAKSGHPRSMTRFALLPFVRNDLDGQAAANFTHAHRTSAEAMLNRAAEAGDREAIRGVRDAYSLGYITTAMGAVPVRKDLAKSTAASSAIAIQMSETDHRSIEEMVAVAIHRMSDQERARFARLQAVYIRAYRLPPTAGDSADAMGEFPETVCSGRW
jgi:hypothetical protein